MPDFTHEMTAVAQRFHRENEWYVVSVVDGYFVLRVRANSERAVELFHRCSAFLEPMVDIVIEHRRDGTSWHKPLCGLSETRDAIGRLRWPLASYGGVELTLVDADDQLTLTPSLELVIYSRRDDWQPRLNAEGVFARVSSNAAEWQSADVPWTPAAELTAALSTLAQRLELTAGS